MTEYKLSETPIPIDLPSLKIVDEDKLLVFDTQMEFNEYLASLYPLAQTIEGEA